MLSYNTQTGYAEIKLKDKSICILKTTPIVAVFLLSTTLIYIKGISIDCPDNLAYINLHDGSIIKDLINVTRDKILVTVFNGLNVMMYFIYIINNTCNYYIISSQVPIVLKLLIVIFVATFISKQSINYLISIYKILENP